MSSLRPHPPKLGALFAYDAGILSDEATARVERHLGSCAACARALGDIRAYAQVRHEEAEVGYAEPDWSKMELVLAREAKAQVRQGRTERALLWPAVALAAAVLLAIVSQLDRSGTEGRGDESARAPGPAPMTADQIAALTPPPSPAQQPLAGEVTALAGGATVDSATGGEPLVIGSSLREGQRIVTGPAANVHGRLWVETGIVVHAESKVRLSRVRLDGIVLALEEGVVSSRVEKLEGAAPIPGRDAPEAHHDDVRRYEVWAEPYVIAVRGTRFAVTRREAGVAVTVDEGVVEVLRDGQLVARVPAPGQWRSSAEIEGLPLHEVPEARALGEVALRWPTLRLPRRANLRRWMVDGSSFLASGEVALRIADGPVVIEAEDLRGRLLRAEVVVGKEGLTLDPEAIRPSAPVIRHGHLPTELVTPVVRAGQPGLRRCYEQALARDLPDVGGRMEVTLTVGLMGDVERAELQAERPPPATFVRCIEGQVMRWQFPPPRGGKAVFAMPLVFSPRR